MSQHEDFKSVFFSYEYLRHINKDIILKKVSY